MNRERLNECGDCGGRLVERERFWVCENCGAIFAIGRDDEGNPFTYHPLQKKDLDFGKIAQKATEINVNQVAVKEIKLKDTIDADVHRETNTLSHQENVRLIIMFLENEEWDAAQDQINQLLLEDFLDAEAGWYSMACSRHTRNDNSLVNSFSEFTDADAIKLDKVIQNASPEFAKRILNLLFKFEYSNDLPTEKIIALALPYLYIDSLYSEKERRKTIDFAFDKMISSGYCSSFEYLLTHTLHSDEVDKYIKYLDRFAQNCPPIIAQKYYSMIIEVDPGNISAHHNLIKADIDADSPSEKCIADFESLIVYTENPDKEVDRYISALINEQTTTTNKSNFMWSLLGYHSKAPEGLKNELLSYAHILINSKLWIEARRYLNLLLSFDARNPEAYYGLCLVQLQSKSKQELISNKENLIDCRELRKAIALYQSTGDDKTANELMAMTQEQKRKKKAKKEMIQKTVVISSIIFVIFSLFFGIRGFNNYRNYSLNNIEIIVTDKEATIDYGYYSNKYKTIFSFTITNNCHKTIKYIEGEMLFYNGNEEIGNATVYFSSSIDTGKSSKMTVDFTGDNEVYQLLYSTPFDNMKIEYKITTVEFEDYVTKTYDKGHRVIKTAKKRQNGPFSELQDSYVGQTVTFGKYESNCDFNTTEDLEWIVVKRDGDKILLFSKYSLISMPFGDWSQEDYVSWKNSKIRSYLNGTFYNECFSSEERRLITSTTNIPSEEEISLGAIQTSDKIFIPSSEEMNTLFYSSNDMRCLSTGNIWGEGVKFSVASASFDDHNSYCSYWLRDAVANAAYGLPAQIIFEETNSSINPYSGMNATLTYNDPYYVRACMWIDLSVISK